jgi:predicted Zn finger-like uncharacterized protein
MRIVCPSCAVSYEVPDSLLKPGRSVRCARCANNWVPLAIDEPELHQAPQSPPTQTEDEYEAVEREETPPHPQLSAMDLLAAHRKREEAPRFLRSAWIASVIVLLGLLAAGVVWRDAAAAAWPPSVRLYQALGLDVTTGQRPASPAASGPGAVAPAPPTKTH